MSLLRKHSKELEKELCRSLLSILRERKTASELLTFWGKQTLTPLNDAFISSWNLNEKYKLILYFHTNSPNNLCIWNLFEFAPSLGEPCVDKGSEFSVKYGDHFSSVRQKSRNKSIRNMEADRKKVARTKSWPIPTSRQLQHTPHTYIFWVNWENSFQICQTEGHTLGQRNHRQKTKHGLHHALMTTGTRIGTRNRTRSSWQ